MKIDDGALKGVLANHYGNFEVESGSDGDDVSTCLYRKGTFFSWVAHCIRFKVNSEYREYVKDDRRQILIELLGKDKPEDGIEPASCSDSPLSRDEERELSRRSQFNARVSGVLKSREKLIAQPDAGRAYAWQKGMLEIRDLRTNAVLKSKDDQNKAQQARSQRTPVTYTIKKVEASVYAQHARFAPNILGPDMDGALSKRFLTYYTFASQDGAARGQFAWQPLSDTQFSAKTAYPGVSRAHLPASGWSLRTPGKRLIERTAALSNAVRGKNIKDAVQLLREKSETGSAEERDTARHFCEFLIRGLGDEFLSE